MFYITLIILFIAVFAFLFWRIIMGARPQQREDPAATYICPVCNESECECHRVENSE